MPRIRPCSRTDLAAFDPMFQELEEFFGFLPKDYLTMGHKPEVLEAVAELTRACVFSLGRTPLTLRLLVAYLGSRAAGCMYCTAHCATLAERAGLAREKIAHIHDYATHPAFTADERSALRLAAQANQVPNAVDDETFRELRRYFDDEGIAEIVAVIGMMSFYNRWNDTLATTLERPSRTFAEANLSWWSGDKHA